MITNEERINLEARIADLEDLVTVENQKRQQAEADRLLTETKFNQLCKDFDEHDAELKRVIANQRAEFDHVNGESAHMLKTQALRIRQLEDELAHAKTYMPGNRAKPMPKTEPVGHCNFAAWGIVETDEEFAAKGKPYVEVVE